MSEDFGGIFSVMLVRNVLWCSWCVCVDISCVGLMEDGPLSMGWADLVGGSWGFDVEVQATEHYKNRDLGVGWCFFFTVSLWLRKFFRGSHRVVFQKGGVGGCSPGTKTGTRVHSHVPPERKPERGYVRMFPRIENRNEGIFAKTTLLRNRHFFWKWILCQYSCFINLDKWIFRDCVCRGLNLHCIVPVKRDLWERAEQWPVACWLSTRNGVPLPFLFFGGGWILEEHTMKRKKKERRWRRRRRRRGRRRRRRKLIRRTEEKNNKEEKSRDVRKTATKTIKQ